MKITLKQRRFLIIWCIFHSFAYISNLIPITFDIHSNDIFTNGDDFNPNYGVWPFVEYFRFCKSCGDWNSAHTMRDDVNVFRGIFFNYNFMIFIIYLIVGISIVYIPKLWGNKKSPTKVED